MSPKSAAATVPKLLKLLGPAWTRAGRCIWMLEELGLSYSHDPQVKPQSRYTAKINPLRTGKVPILLEYDDASQDHQPSFVLTESCAINTYLGDTYGEDTGLVPSATEDKKQRAVYDQTIQFILSELDAQGMWMYRKHVDMAQYFGSIPQMKHVARAHFESYNAVIAKQLNPYLLGSRFTAADILYVNLLDWYCSNNNGKGSWKNETACKWPYNLDTYLKLCHERPAYQRYLQIVRDEKEKESAASRSKSSNNRGDPSPQSKL